MKKHKTSIHQIQQRPTSTIARTTNLNPAWTFDSFVVGPPNIMAFNAAQWVAKAQIPPFNPLFIYGDTGLGKTHLLNAIGHHLSKAHGKRVCWVGAESFSNDYIVALQNRCLSEFRTQYRKRDILLMDDIHFFANKERMQEEFLHTFNALHDTGKMIVMTADQPPRRITGLAADLVSRFESGLCIPIGRPDRATRVAILNRRLADMRAALPAECILYIANVAGWNVRRLEGALIRAVSYKSLSGKELTLPTLKSLLNYSSTVDRSEITARNFNRR